MKRVLLCCLLFSPFLLTAQPAAQGKLWHNKERKVHYLPQGNDFVCVNPVLRFNRALYGTNTAFRVEAGDLPEFAMYMPGMGGNLQMALLKGDQRKWLIRANSIKTIYRAGSMIYEIRDSLLGEGVLHITILALSDAEGMLIKLKGESVPADVKLLWIYGGASGKKFSRDGDIGADPESSFYLKPENCTDNRYKLMDGKFILHYGTGKVLTESERYEIQTVPESALKGEIPKEAKQITGVYPSSSIVKLIDPGQLELAFNNMEPVLPRFCISGKYPLTEKEEYFLLYNNETPVNDLPVLAFEKAEAARATLAGRITISTPDSYLNTLGSALAVAADAIWESPSFMHGAVAWRMRLPGWRGGYVADPLGWHDRARTNFDAYARSQLTKPATMGVVMDTALQLARHLEKVGTQLFSEGYITRNPDGYVGAHHYDMNLVYIDQLLNHFNYTGDTAYVKKMWPLLKRHLAWEKKNFDTDGDGLYDAYAAIWASDALQYSGGGVTHSSAYNFRAFTEAAALARLIGEDGTAFEKEAAKILKSIHYYLWMPGVGWYAEYKDLLGNQLVHPAAGLWTVYHAIDSKVPDPFKSYQLVRYVENHIPHIPVIAKGWEEKGLYLLSETNWQPYTWSLNNVVSSENLHTALAFWQANQKEDAFKLWRSTVLETMYLSAGPGNFQQLSFYDAMRGELYRDFADGVGMMARSLTEGLFGILPEALNDRIIIKPGFPEQWDSARIETPDIVFQFLKNKKETSYNIVQRNSGKARSIRLIIPVICDSIIVVLVNGVKTNFSIEPDRVGIPAISINTPAITALDIRIQWAGKPIRQIGINKEYANNEKIMISSKDHQAFQLFDPQRVLIDVKMRNNSLSAGLRKGDGHKTFFIRTRQGQFVWWQPFNIFIAALPQGAVVNITAKNVTYETVDISAAFNCRVTDIFKQKYLSPRPASPTLQLPVSGIGNWAYHSLQVNLSDSGLRAKAGPTEQFTTAAGLPFKTPADSTKKNIVFTSLWDNFPDSIVIQLKGQASRAHFLMAGSTNTMQSRITNGRIRVNYTDGTYEELNLINPENWWPIEQDYYVDGYAFTIGETRPVRIALKTGREIGEGYKYSSIKGFTGYAIEGGAATILNLPLRPGKNLKNLVLKAIANDVVIGLMSVTLER